MKQFTELTGTNRSCGLAIFLRQTLSPRAQGWVCEATRSFSATIARWHSSEWQGATRENDQQNDRKPRLTEPAISGGDFEEATPDPIPNSEVKLFGADGTARVPVWKSRTPPG